MTATTFDPNFKTTGVALSSGNLVATMPSGSSGNSNAMATRRLTSQFTYWEITPSAVSGTVGIGIANAWFNIALGQVLGYDNHGVGYQQNGNVQLNNVTLATLATYTSGNVIRVCVDLQNQLIYFAVNGGYWNNVSGNNPLTQTGGIPYSTMVLDGVFPAVGGATTTTSQVFTATFTSGFAYTPPTGAASVDVCGAQGIASIMPTQGQFTGIYMPAAPPKSVGGWVEVNGTLTPGRKVLVFDHVSCQLLGTAVTDAYGNYTINTQGSSLVAIVALGDSSYNALVQDEITPS